MSTTLVTSLYDIGRGEINNRNAHRPFSKYLSWFKHVLSINAPMVVFVDQSLAPYVKEHRPKNYQTKVVIQKFEELKAYKYHDRIQNTINRMTMDKKLSHFKLCPEFITAKYQTIIYSKFDFLLEVSEQNPFNTGYFFWLDAGTFYDKPTFDVTLPWPDPLKVKILGDKFLVADQEFNLTDKSPLIDKKKYLRKHSNQICAYTLGGTKNAIQKVHKKFWEEVETLLTETLTTNEQIILQLLILKDPQDYYIWYKTKYNYLDQPIPARNRMIPHELAVGTYCPESYPVNKDLKIITLATKEVSPRGYEMWETSAKHFGYNYEIVGRNTKWSGFKTKIISFKEALERTTEPYAALTDCKDVFFTAPSEELMKKFLEMGKELLVGGESNFHCPKSTIPKETLREYFEQKQESVHRFPNSGFIMGKTKKLLELMTIHLAYQDDQTACFETIYQNKMPLEIDYQTKIIGNIPNVFGKNTNTFEFDERLRRFKNKDSGEYTCVFHFPGAYYSLMCKFYSSIIPQDKFTAKEISTKPTNTSTITFWLILVVIIILLLCFLVLFP